MYLVMARTGAAGPKGISAFLVDKVSIPIVYNVCGDQIRCPQDEGLSK